MSKNDLQVNDNFNIAYANGDVLANVNSNKNNNNNNSAIEDLISTLPTSDQKKQTPTNFNLW